MKYISLFSGVGGLEHADIPPIAVCESDEACRRVLGSRYPKAKVYDDVKDFPLVRADCVVGGWPCQDISIAGKQAGLKGARSGLFYKMVDIARSSGAHTIVGENVPNLLNLDDGKQFEAVLHELNQAGYPFVSWRLLNARQFGLPHHRTRLFIVASKHREAAEALHASTPRRKIRSYKPKAAGFYWTAGTQALCYSMGYVPTLKVGSSLKIPSPPAIHYGSVVRKLGASEALALQGFKKTHFKGLRDSEIFSMAGNAVAQPVGNFVLGAVMGCKKARVPVQHAMRWADLRDVRAGLITPDAVVTYMHEKPDMCMDLDGFIDQSSKDRLSAKAASGLLRRLEASGHRCPEQLQKSLVQLAKADT